MVRKLTVLQMLPALEGGGVERGTLEVAKALVDAGHRSLVMSAGGRMVTDLVAGGSEHFTWPVDRKSLWTLRLVPRLRRFLGEQQVDIVHVRSRVPAWVAWLAWRSMDLDTRPRFVTTVHGLYSVNAYSRIMTRGERVIAVSETAKRYILSSYPGVAPAVIEVIPRGVDHSEFPYRYQPGPEWLDTWQHTFPQLQGKLVLTLPGRLTRLKGHHDFIGLVGDLKRDGYAVHGLIVGGEDPRRRAYAAELRHRVVAEGLAGDVTFLGHRTDMREIFAVSDLVLSLSSKPESFGRTALEALSMGRPVVGYAHGGVGEVLDALFPVGAVPRLDQDGVRATAAALLDKKVCVPQSVTYELELMLSRTLDLYCSLAYAE